MLLLERYHRHCRGVLAATGMNWLDVIINPFMPGYISHTTWILNISRRDSDNYIPLLNIINKIYIYKDMYIYICLCVCVHVYVCTAFSANINCILISTSVGI